MITLTESATTKVDELIKDEGEENLALRVAVRPGGCSGFSYEMYFDSDIADDDETISFGPIRVVVDPSSSMLLQGATLDYKGRESCRPACPTKVCMQKHSSCINDFLQG